MKQKIATTALMLAMSAVMVMAQEQPAEATSEATQVTLREAVQNALQYSKQLQASRYDRELYYQKVREARSGNIPQANTSLTGTTYFGKELNLGGMPIKMANTVTLSAGVSWTLSAQSIVGVKIAKISQQLIDEQVAQNELNVKANVIDTYYALLIYKRNLEILNGNMADMDEIYRHTCNMYAQGVVEATDTAQMYVTVMTLRNTIISVERSMETTKRLLVLQMGLPIDTKIQPVGNLEDFIGESTTATLEQSSFDVEKNYDYRLLELSSEINERTVKLYKWAYAPTLTAAYQYSNALKGGFMNFDHVGTLTLSWNLFNGFKREAQVKEAKIEVERAKTNMSLLQDNLQTNDEQLRYNINTAIDAYLLQTENLRVAKQVLENYKNKYKEGVLSSLELTQANSNYLSAETSYASACLELLTAHTQLSKLYNNFSY